VVANSAGKGATKQDAAEEAAHHGSDGRTATAGFGQLGRERHDLLRHA
jgi:hypothetical protein